MFVPLAPMFGPIGTVLVHILVNLFLLPFEMKLRNAEAPTVDDHLRTFLCQLEVMGVTVFLSIVLKRLIERPRPVGNDEIEDEQLRARRKRLINFRSKKTTNAMPSGDTA